MVGPESEIRARHLTASCGSRQERLQSAALSPFDAMSGSTVSPDVVAPPRIQNRSRRNAGRGGLDVLRYSIVRDVASDMECEGTLVGDVPVLFWWPRTEVRGIAVSLHGLGGRKEDIRPEWVTSVSSRGFLIVTMDAFLHGERAPRGFDLRSEDDYRPELLLETIDRTAHDVLTVVESLRSGPNGKLPIGLRGGSMGGMIALAAVGLGADVDSLLSICGCADYRKSFPKLYGTSLSNQDDSRIADIDPILRADRFFPRSIAMIHGEYDPVVPISGQRALYRKLSRFYEDTAGKCLFLTHAGGHETPSEIELWGWKWLEGQLLGSRKQRT